MEQCVSRKDIATDFRASLSVDAVADAAQIAKDVETIEHDNKIAFEERLRQSGIPHEVIGVEF